MRAGFCRRRGERFQIPFPTSPISLGGPSAWWELRKIESEGLGDLVIPRPCVSCQDLQETARMSISFQ